MWKFAENLQEALEISASVSQFVEFFHKFVEGSMNWWKKYLKFQNFVKGSRNCCKIFKELPKFLKFTAFLKISQKNSRK